MKIRNFDMKMGRFVASMKIISKVKITSQCGIYRTFGKLKNSAISAHYNLYFVEVVIEAKLRLGNEPITCSKVTLLA